MQIANQVGRGRRLQASAGLRQHSVQPIQGLLQDIQHDRRRTSRLAQHVQHRFGGVSQIADRHEASHARAALERMHAPTQVIQ